MTMLQLDPMIPCRTPKGKGHAFLVIDYSQEHNLLFTVAQDNGEIWTYPNHEIRMLYNISLERTDNAKEAAI